MMKRRRQTGPSRRWWIIALCLVIAVAVGAAAYNRFWSAASSARKAGEAFFAAAISGDVEAVESMLADDARLTAEQVVTMYSGLRSARIAGVERARPNESGVDYVVTASGAHESGYTEMTSLLLRRDDDRWVVLSAGQRLEY